MACQRLRLLVALAASLVLTFLVGGAVLNAEDEIKDDKFNPSYGGDRANPATLKEAWLECLAHIQHRQQQKHDQLHQKQPSDAHQEPHHHHHKLLQQPQQAEQQHHSAGSAANKRRLHRSLRASRHEHCVHVLSTYLTQGYEFLVPPRERMRGLVHLGDRERTRKAFSKLLSGQPFNLVILGGSITAGHGAYHNTSLSWPNRLASWLTDHFPNARVHNGATPGMASSYMSMCLRLHCPLNADMVILEYVINDAAMGESVLSRKPYERLVRKLLLYPNQPSVLMLQAYGWDIAKGEVWKNWEGTFTEVAHYYGVPVVSVKAALYSLWLKNVTGFRIDNMTMYVPEPERSQYFFIDDAHPYADTGHKAFAELVMNWFIRSLKHVVINPLQPSEEETLKVEQLLPPIFAGNHVSLNNTCYVGRYLKDLVSSNQGFEWLNDSPDPVNNPKWGYISTNISSAIRFRFRVEVPPDPDDSNAVMKLQLGHLKSYQHMGKMSVECQEGCACTAVVVDGHDASTQTSQIHMQDLDVRLVPAVASAGASAGSSDGDSNSSSGSGVALELTCTLAITVLPETSSGEHKVKLTSLVVTGWDRGQSTHETKSQFFLQVIDNVMRAGGETYALEQPGH